MQEKGKVLDFAPRIKRRMKKLKTTERLIERLHARKHTRGMIEIDGCRHGGLKRLKTIEESVAEWRKGSNMINCEDCIWHERFEKREDEPSDFGCKKPGWEGYTDNLNPNCGGQDYEPNKKALL
jgi:hypothetical protein